MTARNNNEWQSIVRNSSGWLMAAKYGNNLQTTAKLTTKNDSKGQQSRMALNSEQQQRMTRATEMKGERQQRQSVVISKVKNSQGQKKNGRQLEAR